MSTMTDHDSRRLDAVHSTGPNHIQAVGDSRRVRLHDDIHLDHDGQDLVLARPRRGLRLRGLPTPAVAMFERLAAQAVPLDEVVRAFGVGPGATALLQRCAWLIRLEVDLAGHTVSVETIDGTFPAPLLQATPLARVETGHELSRFTVLTPSGRDVRMESPLSDLRLSMTPTALAAILRALSTGDGDTTAFLDTAGLIAGDREASDPLRQWDLHDAIMHTRSRVGGYDAPFGGIFPYLGETEAPPALLSPTRPLVPLAIPDRTDILATDPSLAQVMEERVSTRRWADKPMTLDELSCFLYRVARVRSARPAQPGTPYDTTSRPYPGGGASYELEFYIAALRVDGLAPGVYRYVPQDHALEIISDDADATKVFAARAQVSTGGADLPDALLLLGARFPRVMWKYKGIAYSVILKHAGVVYQTAYLVATAMGLGACGLGSGDSHALSDVTGENPFGLGGVGEMMLGRPASPEASPAAWSFIGAGTTEPGA